MNRSITVFLACLCAAVASSRAQAASELTRLIESVPVDNYLLYFIVADVFLIVGLLSYLWIRGGVDRRRLARFQAKRYTGRDRQYESYPSQPILSEEVAAQDLRRPAARNLFAKRSQTRAPEPVEALVRGVARTPVETAQSSAAVQAPVASVAEAAESSRTGVAAAQSRDAADSLREDTADGGSVGQSATAGMMQYDDETLEVAEVTVQRFDRLVTELKRQRQAVERIVQSEGQLDNENLRAIRTYRSVIIQTDQDKIDALQDFVSRDLNDVYVEIAEWDNAFERLLEMAEQQPLESEWGDVVDKKLDSTIATMEAAIEELNAKFQVAPAQH